MKLFIRLAIVAALIYGGVRLYERYSGDIAPQLTREFSNSLVFVEGKAGKGSGFICAIGGAKFVVTNQHVVAGNPGVKFTLLDQTPVRTGQAAAAVGHDIMSFALLSDAKAMEIMTEVEKNAAIGDDVAVLGNANGDRVITPLPGKLVAIGPDRVEVSAEFVHGNSGSPIIHLKSGTVLGIATYATITKVDSITGRPKDEPEVKRFGYRLDSVKQWQPVVWPAYSGEFALLEKIETRTDDFIKVLRALLRGPIVNANAMACADPAIRSLLERYVHAVNGQGLIKTGSLAAGKDLMASLRNACETDIAQAQAQVKYDYFRRGLEANQQVRRLLYKCFDEVLKRLPK
jgi:hypothetical protein